MSEPRKLKKAELQMGWVKKPEKEGSDPEEELNQIEVHNVPSFVTGSVLKAYFETTKSGGCNNAVADCYQVQEGVFTVTFHDPQGM